VDKLDAMGSFVAVAREGGFSAASRILGQPVATVSRKVALLEQALGFSLLKRSTRHVALTAAGERYFADCELILEAVASAEAAASGEFQSPRGKLILTAPLGFGRRHVQPVILEFARQYPDVQVEVKLTERLLPLLEENIDCALRVGSLADSSLVARRLGYLRRIVCAAPSYLAKHGIPTHPNDLGAHHCISGYGGPIKTWDFRQRSTGETISAAVKVRIAINASDAAVVAACEGFGLVQAGSHQLSEAAAAGKLQAVLRDFEPDPTPVSLVYVGRAQVAAKLRAFIDFAVPCLEERLQEEERIWQQ